MITDDYILRMIRDMVQIIGRLTGKRTEREYIPREEASFRFEDSPPLALRLREMAESGEINEAENLLFEQADFTKEAGISTALNFYTLLNSFSNERLLACDYSREEIYEGLLDCARRSGIDPVLLEGYSEYRP